MKYYQMASEEGLRSLLNSSNDLPVPIDGSNLIFGRPSTLLTGETNTQLNVRGVQGQGYAGQVKVFYNRIDLGVLFRGDYTPEFSALGQSSLYRLLPEINRTLGTAFTEDDLEYVDLRALGEGEQVIIELRARPESLIYSGYTTILFNRRYIMLTDMVQVKAYTQLAHPDPVVDGYLSAGLLTWGIDFTSIADSLSVNTMSAYRRGNWRNYSALKAVLHDHFNIVDWPAINASQDAVDSVRLYETRSLSESNKDFSHVVVQTNIRSNGYSGTAYFHYNV